MIAYNGPYGDYGMFIPLQLATSLRRRTQAHNPIATYWLHHMLETTAGAETRRVRRATNARVGGGGTINAPFFVLKVLYKWTYYL